MSTTEIHREVELKIGLTFSKRQVHRWLKEVGLNLDRAKAGRLRWKKGLMDDAAKKTKTSLVRSQIMGSKIEDMIRWELNMEFAKWHDVEAVVGFTNWCILQRWEVDIPIIVLSRSGGTITKIAVEIDGERWHRTSGNWESKRRALTDAGWHALRVLVTSDEQKRMAHQVYVRQNVSALPSVSSLFQQIRTLVNQA